MIGLGLGATALTLRRMSGFDFDTTRGRPSGGLHRLPDDFRIMTIALPCVLPMRRRQT